MSAGGLLMQRTGLKDSRRSAVLLLLFTLLVRSCGYFGFPCTGEPKQD